MWWLWNIYVICWYCITNMTLSCWHSELVGYQVVDLSRVSSNFNFESGGGSGSTKRSAVTVLRGHGHCREWGRQSRNLCQEHMHFDDFGLNSNRFDDFAETFSSRAKICFPLCFSHTFYNSLPLTYDVARPVRKSYIFVAFRYVPLSPNGQSKDNHTNHFPPISDKQIHSWLAGNMACIGHFVFWRLDWCAAIPVQVPTESVNHASSTLCTLCSKMRQIARQFWNTF